MAGCHLEKLCNAFSCLASQREGNLTEYLGLLDRPASKGGSTRRKALGKNHAWTRSILTPEATHLDAPADPLPRTREISEGSDIFRLNPMCQVLTDGTVYLS